MRKAEVENNMSSSSDEEDGDEQWKAAINAVASTSYPGYSDPKPGPTPAPASYGDDDDYIPHQSQPKHYQIKAQKVLDEILEKSLFMVKDCDTVNVNEDGPANVNATEDDPVANGGGVRLFKQAPVGIVFDHGAELKGPTKKPNILHEEEIDEKSKKFKRKLRSIVVEGTDILAAAELACQKSKARLEAKEAAAKEAAKKEEERVAELKKIRGEKWLPSMAKQMKLQHPGR